MLKSKESDNLIIVDLKKVKTEATTSRKEG